MTDDLFERAAEANIESVAGVPLFKTGRRMRGECPLCGHGKKKRGGGPFWIDPDTGRFGCFSSGCEGEKGGDVIDLERLLGGGTPREAAERLVGVVVSGKVPKRAAPAAPYVPKAPDVPTSADQRAAQIWRESRPAEGTLAERYLRHRGLEGPVLAGLLRRLRFHPHALWGGEPGNWIFAPAMVAAIHTPSGPTGGIHCTYLRADGFGKAALDPAKRMWGRQQDSEGRPGGCWLIGPKGKGPLIVGEGIESSASAAQLYGKPCRVAAALSLRALQGGWQTDKWGRYDPDMPTGDPTMPPFTWPLADLDVPEVMIAVDRDMKPIAVKARAAGGGTWKPVLSADQRARICGTLAVRAWWAWNNHLPANAVRAIGPGAGRDFNTELQERAA